MAHQSDSTAGSSGKSISPIQMQKHLKGVNYPASKQDLVKQAQSNHASSEIVNTIQHLHGDSFNSPKDVMKALGQAH